MVAVTQPRRVAAMSVAKRVAEEAGCKLGNEVGYSIRFEDKTTPKTQIKFCTDGVLLQEAKTDPLLSNYSVVMIDEAHERSLQSDLLLVLCREVCHARPEFKLIILSATINAAKFSRYFFDCPVFNIPGRTYPVDIMYTQSPEANYLSASISTIWQVHISATTPGDILVFLTGEEEILAAMESIEETKKKLGNRVKELVVAPIYSALPPELQAKAFEQCGPDQRKVILATNIAETSVTFDGVTHVIDCGYSKENVYVPALGLSSLVVTPISKASSSQRAGRAGRTSAGNCYRLYTKFAYHNELSDETVPEILRTCLDGVVLTLKQLGIQNILEFEFLDSPSSDALIKSLESLYALGALDSTGALTRLGRKMAELPLDIMLSKAIIESQKYSCREEILSIVSMTQEAATLFLRPKDKKVAADAARARFTSTEGGDLLTYLNIWNQYVESGYDQMWARENYLQARVLTRVRDVREQLVRLADRVDVPESSAGSDHIAIRKCLTSAFFLNTARLQRDGQSYRTLSSSGLTVYIHPSSCLIEKRPRWCIFASLQATSKEWMMGICPIESEWLVEVAPHIHTESSIGKLGDNKKMGKIRGQK
jgi:pre-mRNA-splicing factor ATP-dependent RNA helicase DHX16